MACIDQYQLRNSSNNLTTAVGSWLTVWDQMQHLGLNDNQLAAVSPVMISASYTSMFNSVGGMQAAALKVQGLVYMLLSLGLPSNQCQIEVGGWFDTALAGLQYIVLSSISKNVDGLAPWAAVEFPNTNISEHRATCDQ